MRRSQDQTARVTLRPKARSVGSRAARAELADAAPTAERAMERSASGNDGQRAAVGRAPRPVVMSEGPAAPRARPATPEGRGRGFPQRIETLEQAMPGILQELEAVAEFREAAAKKFAELNDFIEKATEKLEKLSGEVGEKQIAEFASFMKEAQTELEKLSGRVGACESVEEAIRKLLASRRIVVGDPDPVKASDTEKPPAADATPNLGA